MDVGGATYEIMRAIVTDEALPASTQAWLRARDHEPLSSAAGPCAYVGNDVHKAQAARASGGYWIRASSAEAARTAAMSIAAGSRGAQQAHAKSVGDGLVIRSLHRFHILSAPISDSIEAIPRDHKFRFPYLDEATFGPGINEFLEFIRVVRQELPEHEVRRMVGEHAVKFRLCEDYLPTHWWQRAPHEAPMPAVQFALRYVQDKVATDIDERLWVRQAVRLLQPSSLWALSEFRVMSETADCALE